MAHSEQPTNTIQTWHPQAQAVRSPGLHRRIPPNTSRPCVKSLHSIQCSGRPLPMDQSSYGIKGSGPYFQRSMANCVLTDLIFPYSPPLLPLQSSPTSSSTSANCTSTMPSSMGAIQPPSLLMSAKSSRDCANSMSRSTPRRDCYNSSDSPTTSAITAHT